MNILYYIKDARTNEFYWRHRLEEGFTKEIKDARNFYDEIDAINELELDYLKELFSDRFIEIVKIYSLTE
jgi:hypothetical protein